MVFNIPAKSFGTFYRRMFPQTELCCWHQSGGTTNGVVYMQAPDKGGGKLDRMPNPYSKSLIIISVVAFVDAHKRYIGSSSKYPLLPSPHPTHVSVL